MNIRSSLLRKAALLMAGFAVIGALSGCRVISGKSSKSEPGAVGSGETVFEGAAFRVTYPRGFTVRPSMKSRSGEGYDSVFFTSPDRRVVYYVCAPAKYRTAYDVAVKSGAETRVSDVSMKSGGERIRQYIAKARNGSYERLVEEISNSASSAAWTFAFQYANQSAYDDYLPSYKEFKFSLEQNGE